MKSEIGRVNGKWEVAVNGKMLYRAVISGTGRCRAIAWFGAMAVTVEFDNGVRQMMRGNALPP